MSVRAGMILVVALGCGGCWGASEGRAPAVAPPAGTSEAARAAEGDPELGAAAGQGDAPTEATGAARAEGAGAPETREEPLAAGLADEGIFGELDERVSLRAAPWLSMASARLVVDGARRVATLYQGSLPVKSYPLEGGTGGDGLSGLGLRGGDRRELEGLEGLSIEAPAKVTHACGDSDGDGIPDPVDAALGGRKVALNAAEYREGYEGIGYPGGDVERDHGVCTDVVVRAWRNAGVDLQRLILEDMKRAPKAYGLAAGRSGDKNIEHRRVRRQIVYFKRHHRSLTADFDPQAQDQEAWLPGDVVFMDTFPSKPGPDHVGLVSDKVDEQGRPLIINNWTVGYRTGDMALLGSVPVTHRFRVGLPVR